MDGVKIKWVEATAPSSRCRCGHPWPMLVFVNAGSIVYGPGTLVGMQCDACGAHRALLTSLAPPQVDAKFAELREKRESFLRAEREQKKRLAAATTPSSPAIGEWRTEAMGDEWDYVVKAHIGVNGCVADIEATKQVVGIGPDHGIRQEVVAHGFLRFDGCVNLAFDDPAEKHAAMAHFCDVAAVKRFGEMLERLYRLGQTVLEEEGTWMGPMWPTESDDG